MTSYDKDYLVGNPTLVSQIIANSETPVAILDEIFDTWNEMHTSEHNVSDQIAEIGQISEALAVHCPVALDSMIAKWHDAIIVIYYSACLAPASSAVYESMIDMEAFKNAVVYHPTTTEIRSLVQLEKDKEWAKKLYEKVETKAADHHEFMALADSIHKNLGDKEWTKKVYKKAEDKAEDYDDSFNLIFIFFCSLGDSIHDNLGDKEWAAELYKKAEDKAEHSNALKSVAKSIRDNLGDKKWAVLVDQKAKELE